MPDTSLLADFVTQAELAAQVDRDTRTIARWTNRPNGLPHVRLGNQPLYHLPTVREWLLSQMCRPNPRRARAGEAA
jgi:hypothetical protein